MKKKKKLSKVVYKLCIYKKKKNCGNPVLSLLISLLSVSRIQLLNSPIQQQTWIIRFITSAADKGRRDSKSISVRGHSRIRRRQYQKMGITWSLQWPLCLVPKRHPPTCVVTLRTPGIQGSLIGDVASSPLRQIFIHNKLKEPFLPP